MSLGIRVFQAGKHISLGICVSPAGKHISLEICVSPAGKHISLGICVSQVGEHISLGYLPESNFDVKTQQVFDDFYPKALQWCRTGDQPDNLVSLNISKCYPSILINNIEPIPLYTIHDIIEPFTHKHQLDYYGEFYIDEFIIKQFGANIKIEPGFYSRRLNT